MVNFSIRIDYRNIRNGAWIFLLSNKVNRLPVDLKKIAEKNNWALLVYEHNKEVALALDKTSPLNCEGWTVIYDNKVFIFFKGSRNEGRNRFTIAHEFGHIALHHLKELKREEYEQEANMFAARILMPLCILKECRVQTAEEIADLCRVSLESANYRAERLKFVSERNMFYKSPLERQVAIQFKDYITEFNSHTYPEAPFHEILKKLRENYGFTQNQVAQRLHIPENEYEEFERNEREPNFAILVKIARMFNVSLDYLFGQKITKDNIEVLFQSLTIKQRQRVLDFISGIMIETEMF